MVRILFLGLIILFALSTTGLAQLSISIDAQKDPFYNQLHSPAEGCLTLLPSDFIPSNGPKPGGNGDLSARVWMAWDSTYFYFYTEVKDDIIRVTNDMASFNDCMELKFDPDPTKKPLSGIVNARLTALDSSEADNILGVDNLYPEAVSENLDPAACAPDNYARRLTVDGYVLELRLAWKWIRADGRKVHAGTGNIFGLAINFHDNDSEQRDGSIQWSAGMADEVWNTPQLLGTAEFLPDHRLKLTKRNSIDTAARPGTTYLSNERLERINGSLIGLENWKYHSGDESDWSDPDFDDAHWETTTTLLSPDNLPQSGWQGTGWFRIHMVIDSALVNIPLGLSIWQAGISRIYLDGILIYTFGEERDDWTGLPKVLTFTGNERHVIAVRYSNMSFMKYHNAGYNAGFQLQLGRLNPMAENTIRREKTFLGYQMFLTALPLAIGLLHLILFAFSPGLRQNLFFALFLFSYAAAVFFDYQILLATDVDEQLRAFRIHSAMLPFWALFQLRFVYSLFYKKLPKLFWIISPAAFCLGALVIYKPQDNFGFFSILYMALYIEISRAIGLALFKKKEGAWIIGMAFLAFFVFGALDTLMDLGIIVILREMENPYAFGSIGFFIAMSVYLARDFARTNKKIAEQEMEHKLLEAENARQSKELEEARQLQLSMLPKELPQLPDLEIGVFMKTATEVGGDYYDFHVAGNGTLTIAIGDATGHGMKAGTMVASMKSLFGIYDEYADLPHFFNRCGSSIKRMKLGSLYMALLLVKINGHKMTASSAGMPPVLIYRSETGIVEEMVIKGMPLGGPSGLSYQTKETDLNPGNTLLLMSDGFPELFNEKMEMLDYRRVKEYFREVAVKSPDEIIAHLNEAGERWRNGKPQDDDITFVVLKVKPDR